MNQLATLDTGTLPAYLQGAQGATNTDVISGLSVGAQIYQIGIKQARWRLQDPQGEELVVPHLHLDVIIVGANPNNSKIFYKGAYNPAEEGVAPDCYSDNGVAPSNRASSPQALSCAACPHNVWGSKVNPNGSQTKACADAKKVAVILAENPTGPVYLLKIPPASLKNLYTIISSLQQRNIDSGKIIMRMTFDTSADYPKIVFNALGWITPQQWQAVQELATTDEVAETVNKNDVPRPANPLPAPGAATAAPAPQPAPGLTNLINQPQPVYNPPPAAPVPQPAPQPQYAYPPQPTVVHPAPAAPAPTVGYVEPAVPTQEAPKRRGRKAAAAPAPQPAPQPTQAPAQAEEVKQHEFFAKMRAANAAARPVAQAAPTYTPPPMQPALADVPGAYNPAQAVTTAPAGTDASLDALIQNTLNL